MAPLPPPERERLLDIASEAIAGGLEGRMPSPPDPATLPPSLAELRGVFVTLHVDGRLNGCIGTLEPEEPLAAAVARRAWDAAFADPRLPRLRRDDWDGLRVDISVLSPLVRLDVGSRDELVAALQPGREGVLVTAGGRRATFLPSVWEQLPDVESFLDHLWAKAGLAPGSWPDGLVVERYTAESFGRDRLTPTPPGVPAP